MLNCKSCREEVSLQDDLTATCFKHQPKFNKIIDKYLEKEMQQEMENIPPAFESAIIDLKIDHMKELFDLYLLALQQNNKHGLNVVKNELMLSEIHFNRD